MKPFRLMDLDLLVQKGLKSRQFNIKVKDINVNLNAVQYAIERILCFHVQGCLVCILKQDINEDEVISARDPLGRICYEILGDKLETMGLCVKSFKNRQELEDFAYDLCNRGFRGVNPFATVRAMIDCKKLYTLITMSRAIAVDSDIAVTIDTYDACDEELEIPMLSYTMLYILKEHFSDNYVEMYKEYLSLDVSPVDYSLPITMANFLKSKMDSGKITQVQCVNAMKHMLSLNEGLDRPINFEEFDRFNREGAITLLTGFNLKTALELLGVYELNYTKQTSVIHSYLVNKLSDYASEEYSLRNGLSLETDYFSTVSETVSSSDGKVVSSDRNDEFLTESELLNEFL